MYYLLNTNTLDTLKIKLNRSLLFAYIIGTSEIEKVNIYIINCFLKRDGGEKSITVDKLINS